MAKKGKPDQPTGKNVGERQVFRNQGRRERGGGTLVKELKSGYDQEETIKKGISLLRQQKGKKTNRRRRGSRGGRRYAGQKNALSINNGHVIIISGKFKSRSG